MCAHLHALGLAQLPASCTIKQVNGQLTEEHTHLCAGTLEEKQLSNPYGQRKVAPITIYKKVPNTVLDRCLKADGQFHPLKQRDLTPFLLQARMALTGT